MLIALPDIFRGIHINPLAPANTNYLLWMILSFLIVTAVLVVSLGRIGDMYGRIRIYNLGVAVFTVFAILLFLTPITDAFHENERGLALGINGVAAIAGTFLGLITGGVLAPPDWRLVFWFRSRSGCSGRCGRI